MRPTLFLPLLCLSCATAAAQAPWTAHTLRRDSTAALPSATLADVAWLVGHWAGEGPFGWNDEVWAPAAGDALAGVYRILDGDRVALYELLTITEENGTLVFRLKHFRPDLSGLEDAGPALARPLLRLEPAAAYFEGLTYRRDGPGAATVFVALDGGAQEGVFPYRRARP